MRTNDEKVVSARRNALVGLAGVGLAASLPRVANAYGGGTGISGYFDVTLGPYSADPNGVQDSSPHIQAAINDASTNGGGVVWIPPGSYKLGSGLVVPDQVMIVGSGWATQDYDNFSHLTGNGSWLLVSSTTFTPITVNGRGVTIANLAFFHQQPAPASGWNPANYPPAIDANNGDIIIENIFLKNATRGIYIRGKLDTNYTNGMRVAVGRVTLRHIWGQPIKEGVRIDNALDVVKIEDVHFWPFWSNNSVVRNYQSTTACYALLFERVDNPHLTNIFVFGYRRGFYFTKSIAPSAQSGPSTYGITSRFLMSNCGADSCSQGVCIDGAGTSGMITNFYCAGSASPVNGIQIAASNVLLQCSTIRCTKFNTNAVRVEGENAVVTLENFVAENWNLSGLGFPAIGGIAPAKIYVGRSRIFVGGGGAAEIGTLASGDTATFIVDG